LEVLNVKLIPVHRYAYRHKKYEDDGIITGMYNVLPNHEQGYRLCYEVTYPDGFKDYVPVSNIESGVHRLCKYEVKEGE